MISNLASTLFVTEFNRFCQGIYIDYDTAAEAIKLISQNHTYNRRIMILINTSMSILADQFRHIRLTMFTC